ncbi:hypothetical protein TNCV_1062561 [Trichonephila clavipes]|nr:hypothetical protein TNCV_1062561 [Trichonephila clavipes]
MYVLYGLLLRVISEAYICVRAQTLLLGTGPGPQEVLRRPGCHAHLFVLGYCSYKYLTMYAMYSLLLRVIVLKPRSHGSVILRPLHTFGPKRKLHLRYANSLEKENNRTPTSKNLTFVYTESSTVRKSSRVLKMTSTATAGSDVVQSGRPIFDDFFQHLWPYIGNNTANVVFQMVKRLWLIRIDQ